MSRLKDIIKRTVKVLRANLITETWKKKAFYLSADYPGEITIASGTVTLHLLKLRLERDSFSFVLDAYDILREIFFARSAAFSISGDSFLMEINGICLNPTTAEELFIIKEIFVDGTYNFDLADRTMVIDIGMNVGTASLFFASQTSVEKVFGFEPLRPTFEHAEVNFGLNPHLSGKIEAVNYGLARTPASLTVDYDYSNKGQIGIQGTAYVRSPLRRVEKQTIVIKSASAELKRILDSYADYFFILKVDCEGSEYVILQDLLTNNLLSRFKMVLIEWHEHGPEPLIGILRQSKFASFYQSSSTRVGMVYAVR